MAYFLFIDESGHDRVHSPYEVLSGIAIKDDDVWNIINALHDAEIKNFGCRYSDGHAELKATKILKKKVFTHASLNVEVKDCEISKLATRALKDGKNAGVKELKALALAKLNYVKEVFEICSRFRCKAFASIVDPWAQDTTQDGLRKDYAYLFERFYYFLEDHKEEHQGIIVFDELEKSQSHILIHQAQAYFKGTSTGKHRSNLIIPEPFFVHSELTTGVQIADLIAYIISWGLRLPQMDHSKCRAELKSYADQVYSLQYKATRERMGNPDFYIWSFKLINDLRTKQERSDI